MTRNFYMHTIDGIPGQFSPQYKCVQYAGKYCARLATSLPQIRREQRIDRANAGQNAGMYTLGYVRIPSTAVLK